MSENQTSVQTLTVHEKNGKTFLTTTYNKVLVAGAAAMPLLAFADIDVSEGVTQLGYALAALGALGAAKLAPSAIMWVWSMVTAGARRG